jgi:hypothetical protein
MRRYFTQHFTQRFGRSQLFAGLLLLVFLAQGLWLVHQNLQLPGLSADEIFRLEQGLSQWRSGAGGAVAGTPSRERKGTESPDAQSEIDDPAVQANNGYDPEHSPLWYLIGAAPVAAWRHPPAPGASGFIYWAWLIHIPFLACGAALGASLWYVARRLCSNVGGFIALILYCFSPAMIKTSALWHTEPEIFAAWGAFGAVFTAIAVGHTLYAPREVVLWNWRRITLLGISLWIAVGCQFSMIAVVPLALLLLLYVAPVRRQAAVVIWFAACVVGLVALLASYFFHGSAFAESLRHATFWGATWRGFIFPGVYKQLAVEIGRGCPALVVVLPVVVVTYLAWPRSRYFGNTAPSLVALLFLGLVIAHPHTAGAGFLLAAFPFLFIFVAGVLADLIETRHRSLVTACVVGMLAAYAILSLRALVQVPIG